MTIGKVFIGPADWRVFLIRLAVTVCAGLLSFWINGLALHVWNGVDIILGVPLGILIAVLYGPGFGCIAAVVGTVRTVFLWRHPYALIIYAIESIAVGAMVRRGAPVVVSSLLFWSCAGIPFVFFCYTGILGLSTQFALMIAVADCLAGLFGSILVHLVRMPQVAAPFWRAIQAKLQVPSMRADVFTVTILMGTLPLAVLLGYDGYYMREARESEAKVFLRGATDLGVSCINRFHADQKVRMSMILREIAQRGGGDGILAAMQLEGETLAWGQGAQTTFAVSAEPSGDSVRIRQAYSSGERAVSRQLVSERVMPVRQFCPISQVPSDGWRISLFSQDLKVLGTPWGSARLKVRSPEASIANDLRRELAARNVAQAESTSFVFQKSGQDAFRRGRYFVDTGLTAGGVLVVAYQPASAAAPGVAEFQQITIFWLSVSAILSVLFAHGSIARILTPLEKLAQHLSETNWRKVSPSVPQEAMPLELVPVWKGVAEMERRLGVTLSDLANAAEQANRTTKQKSDFFATISHEIRTPLNCILGMLPAAAKGPLTPRQQEALGMMRRSGEHLLLLINNVLDFSKVESGAFTIAPTRLELLPFLDECFLLLKPTARAKQLLFWWHYEGAFPKYVKCDGIRLRQILFNVVGNAIKFTLRGEVFVDVRIRQEDGRSVLLMEVRDTGPGIDENFIDKVFAPFSQLAAPIGSADFAGAGLGLAISRQLLELMGGTISIAAPAGSGACVRIRLPLATLGEEQFQAFPPANSPGLILVGPPTEIRECMVDHFRLLRLEPRLANSFSELEPVVPDDALIVVEESIVRGNIPSWAKVVAVYPEVARRESGWKSDLEGGSGDMLYCWPPSMEALGSVLAPTADKSPSLPHENEVAAKALPGFPLRILVAEDNQENRVVAELLLQELGFTPDMVQDGEAAIAALHSNDFDMCLIDLRMPKKDGIAVVREIRAEQGSYAPFLVALTASAFSEDRDLCLSAGFDGFLSKPLREEVLRELIEGRVVPLALANFRQKAMDMSVHNKLVALLSKSGPDAANVKVNNILEEISDWGVGQANSPQMPATAGDDAHRWAGSASLIGASRLAAALGRMEMCAKTADLPAWRREAHQLCHLINQTKAAISSLPSATGSDTGSGS